MTVKYFSYDAAGKIIWRGECDVTMVAAQGIDGLTAAIGNADPETHYAPNGDITRRPVNPSTLTGYTLNNVPVGAGVRINRTDYIAEDSTIEISFPYPGTYQITVSAFPFLDATWTVTK